MGHPPLGDALKTPRFSRCQSDDQCREAALPRRSARIHGSLGSLVVRTEFFGDDPRMRRIRVESENGTVGGVYSSSSGFNQQQLAILAGHGPTLWWESNSTIYSECAWYEKHYLSLLDIIGHIQVVDKTL